MTQQTEREDHDWRFRLSVFGALSSFPSGKEVSHEFHLTAQWRLLAAASKKRNCGGSTVVLFTTTALVRTWLFVNKFLAQNESPLVPWPSLRPWSVSNRLRPDPEIEG